MNLPKIRLNKLFLYGTLALFAVFIYSCASSPAVDLLKREGAKFNRDLTEAVRSADKIMIVEYSHSSDFNELNIDPTKAPSYTYSRKTLTSEDREYFAQQVNQLSNAKREVYAKCAFVPHHTIYFYQNGKPTSSMKICFKCGDIKWENGSKHIESKDLFKALNAVVKRAGLSPDADWKKKASDRYQSDLEKQQEKEKQAEKSKYPTAIPVPGKPRFVFNPFTQNHVNVDGIPSGTKVIDPHDKQKRIFLVP